MILLKGNNLNVKKQLIIQFILCLGVSALIGGIFILSSQDGEASHRLSVGLLRKIKTFVHVPASLKQLSLDFRIHYDFILRKTAHFSLFFLLAILLYFAYRSINKKNIFLITFLSCAVFAALDELHQVFVIGRTAKIMDVSIDMAGSSVAIILIALLKKPLAKSRLKLKSKRSSNT